MDPYGWHGHVVAAVRARSWRMRSAIVRTLRSRGRPDHHGWGVIPAVCDQESCIPHREGPEPIRPCRRAGHTDDVHGRVAHGGMVAAGPMHAEASHSLARRHRRSASARAVIDALAASEWRGVQLDARDGGMRPHGRRVGPSRSHSLLSRRQLTLTGIDLASESAFSDPSTQERAVDRTIDCIRLASALGASSISTVLPDRPASRSSACDRRGVGGGGVEWDPCGRLQCRGACSADDALVHALTRIAADVRWRSDRRHPWWGDRLAAARLDDVSPNGLYSTFHWRVVDLIDGVQGGDVSCDAGHRRRSRRRSGQCARPFQPSSRPDPRGRASLEYNRHADVLAHGVDLVDVSRIEHAVWNTATSLTACSRARTLVCR